MPIVDNLPNRPLTDDEFETLRQHDSLEDVVAVAFISSMRRGRSVSEIVLATSDSVYALAFVEMEWERLYSGEIGLDGTQEELFDEAYHALEESSETPEHERIGID